MDRGNRLRTLLYFLFTLSGFAGLIYESIWSHYLKLFLGHAAYAQTLVLAIFMGGMAIGSWLAGRWSSRLRRPLRSYALVEAALGVCALAFDPLFRGMQSWMFDAVIPRLGSPLAIDLVKWTSSALIILPQSVLLGATFPLMSAGIVRLHPQSSGRSLSWLYFTNSLGAAVGVLVSGFYLIAHGGLPGTIAFAGFINAGLAIAVLLIANAQPQADAPSDTAAQTVAADSSSRPRIARMLITVAFLTGTASFFYEIGWIRLLSLVLGSATHSFELMLSAFITGIALGSFVIRNRIASEPRPLRLLGWIQLAMGCAAFLSIPVYNQSFDWMAFIIHGLARSDAGYTLFNLLSHGICLALMLPVTFFAGMTLPLITATLLNSGAGESSIGRVYAANTLGSIAGVVLAVHLVMPQLGLRQVIVCGAFLDLGLGIWLLARAGDAPRGSASIPTWIGIATALCVGGCVTLLVHFDPAQLASGVYRQGNSLIRKDASVIFHRDGKTASVDVLRFTSGLITIATNGKIDAGILPGPVPSVDDYTMVMLAGLPMLENPQATRAAVIGMGSGRSTHVLLANPRLSAVDTVEIEPAMAQGARQFGELTHRSFDDPRSHIHYEDAKTYFARSGQHYDIIVAEPSNPWVSGVSSLFSTEFYGQVKRYLAPHGVFVQWLQLYEINVPLVATVLNALGSQFDDYAIYAASDGDLVVVASPQGALPAPSDWVFGEPALADMLGYVDIHSLADLESRDIGHKRTLAPFFAAQAVAANSDYFPVLDQYAVKQRFMHHSAGAVIQMRTVSARLEGTAVSSAPLAPTQHYTEGIHAEQAQHIAPYLARSPLEPVPDSLASDSELMQMLADISMMNDRCDPQTLNSVWLPAFSTLAANYLPYLTEPDTRDIVQSLKTARCYDQSPQLARNWIDFFEAIGEQHWTAAQQSGAAILAAEPKDQPVADALARELLLSDIRAGDIPAAKALLNTLDAAALKPAPMHLLRATVESAR